MDPDLKVLGVTVVREDDDDALLQMDASMFEFVDARTGLSGLFGGSVIVSTDVAHCKPEPDLFLAAAARIGVAPESCIVIEDARCPRT